MTEKMFALVSDQGTAMHETALCGKCHAVPENQGYAEDQASMADDWDKEEGWHDCTGNEYLQCITCGAPDFEGMEEL